MNYEPVDILISFDSTGSMHSCLREVRRQIESITKDFFTRFSDLRIGIINHGNNADYPRNIEFTLFSSNQSELVNFIKFSNAMQGGGDFHHGIGNPANYELVLASANGLNNFEWRKDAKKFIIMFGDVDAQLVGEKGRAYTGTETVYDWTIELEKVASNDIKIFAVQCLGVPKAKYFWTKLADATNGKYIELNQLSQIVELLTLAIYSVHDENLANTYAEGLSLNRGFKQIAFQILGKQSFSNFDQNRQDGLVPVEPFRFQRLHVDKETEIKTFVNDSNLGQRYKIGRGFYQLSKTEIIQERKEVILVDKITGDMFSGIEARKLIDLPYGERGRINPRILPKTGNWIVFIQSTSVNRKLMPNTEFLYEI